MDTHIADTTLIPPLSTRQPEMALAGEEEGEAPPAAPVSETGAPARRSLKGALLGSAAVLAVLTVGAGVFLISPYNTILPVGVQKAVSTVRESAESTARQASEAVSGLVAPAARMATSPNPEPTAAPQREQPPRAASDAQIEEIVGYRQQHAGSGAGSATNGATPRPAERPRVEAAPLARRVDEPARPAEVARPTEAAPPATREAPQPAPAGLQASPAKPVEAPPVAVPPAAPPIHAASAPEPTIPSLPASTAAAPSPVVVLPPPVPAAARPADPVAVAAALQPGPMTTRQQVDVLGLVTQLGIVMRNREERDRQMQADLASMREQLENSTADFARRLALAEARGAMNAAMGAAATPVVPSVPVPVSANSSVTTVAARPATPAPASPAPAADSVRRRYRVQAASPGLAMLSDVDRNGGQLQVAVGDDVPGYGKVTAIVQQGSSWVVRAERGTIQ